MHRIYVIANSKRRPAVAAILNGLLPWLRKNATVVKVDRNGNSDLRRINADLILVFGGDGSILGAARRLNGNPIPVFGVNMGQLGFLAEIAPDELSNVLPAMLRGDYVLSPRMMLQVTVPADAQGSVRIRSESAGGAFKLEKRRRHFEALNDAVLLRLPMASMMTVRVTVCGEEIAMYKGDGLIVSTATGSTGYNLSAGGPILSERLKAMIITPVCPHTLANRPIVLSGDETVEVSVETRTGSPAELVMDGQISCSLKSGSVVKISKAPYEFNLATLGKKGRYEIIRDKLHWAGWVKDVKK